MEWLERIVEACVGRFVFSFVFLLVYRPNDWSDSVVWR